MRDPYLTLRRARRDRFATWQAKQTAALVIAAMLGGAALGAVAGVAVTSDTPALPGESYSLIGRGDGSEYVLDSGLTASDCLGRSTPDHEMFAFIYCEREGAL